MLLFKYYIDIPNNIDTVIYKLKLRENSYVKLVKLLTLDTHKLDKYFDRIKKRLEVKI